MSRSRRLPPAAGSLALVVGVLGPLVAGVPLATALQGGPVADPVHAKPDPGATTAEAPTVSGDDLVFTERMLNEGSAIDAGLLPEYIDAIVPNLQRYLEPGTDRANPSFAGAVVLAATHGVIVEHDAIGHAVKYSDVDNGNPVELPAGSQVPMRKDTVFDMASVTKLFTAVCALSLADEGPLDFDAPVADYLPAFASSEGKAQVTVAQLLNHTSGLPAWLPLYSEDSYDDRIAAVLSEPLAATPGERYEYSDLNLITLGKVVEAAAGEPLDIAVTHRITEPLGMADTRFNPPANEVDRIAATAVIPGRGAVRGQVHDANALSLNGVAGHAGIFSTASDMAIFAQMLLNGGTYAGERVLSESSVRDIFTNENAGMADEAARGRGFQLGQRYYMDALSSPVTIGHTGFTGTSIVIDPLSESFLILLTNRVHPTDSWGTTSEYRRSPARDLARAIPVEPSVGPEAWFSGQPEVGTSTLTAPLSRATSDGLVAFRLWYDTTTDGGHPDEGLLLASSDGETFEPIPVQLSANGHTWDAATIAGFSGRQWLQARAELPDGTTHVRWAYETRADAQGRGIYVDHIRVADTSGRVFNSHYAENAEQLVPDGWYPSAN